MVRGRQIPNLSQFEATAVNLLGTRDVVYQPQYDILTYAAAGQAVLTFFATPQGQGVTSHPGGAGAKTLADTNLTLAGQIPAPQKFMAIAVEVVFYPGSLPGRGPAAQATIGQNANDQYVVMRSGSLIFTVGQKNYAQDAPIGAFPAQTKLDGVYAVADATTAAVNSLTQIELASVVGAPYVIQPTTIPHGQNFSVVMTWPNLIALPSTVAGRIGVKLLGWLARSAQ